MNYVNLYDKDNLLSRFQWLPHVTATWFNHSFWCAYATCMVTLQAHAALNIRCTLVLTKLKKSRATLFSHFFDQVNFQERHNVWEPDDTVWWVKGGGNTQQFNGAVAVTYCCLAWNMSRITIASVHNYSPSENNGQTLQLNVSWKHFIENIKRQMLISI